MEYSSKSLGIPDVLLIRPVGFIDQRGLFLKLYQTSSFRSPLPTDVKEVYYSTSNKGVIRGLHFQDPPFEQGKLVTVVKGSIFDVAVDLRGGSISFGMHMSYVLTDRSCEILWIPAGFAHGFQALEDNTIVLNMMTEEYNPSHEGGVRYSDDSLRIKWPLENLIVSEKDLNLPLLKDVRSKVKAMQSDSP